MATWPGGACPNCGEYMPQALIHCQTCRALLNDELESDSVEVPEFVPLREIATMVDVEPGGFFIGCPICDRELRINRKYEGERVQCNFCSGQFLFDPESQQIETIAFYVKCAHCSEELRAARKYLGAKVVCKHCGGKLHFREGVK